MAATLTVPIVITPEATARVTDLGLGKVVEQMVEQASRIVPGLKCLRLSLEPSFDMDDIPWLILECFREGAAMDEQALWMKWNDWRVASFPVEIGRHFFLRVHAQEAAHGG
jgi:hypothetical protein